MECLTLVRSLAQNHTDILLPKLHGMCLAVVKILRSMVLRTSMTTLAHMSSHLWRAMDAKAELVACMLLHKVGESNLFNREDKDLVLGAMGQSCSPN
ncbi:hypothetical protein P4O66_019470, partial [Electrophorus voltai]